MACKAHRVNDQMICPCGKQWDVNDPAPPTCRTETIVGKVRNHGENASRAAYKVFINRMYGVIGEKK